MPGDVWHDMSWCMAHDALESSVHHTSTCNGDIRSVDTPATLCRLPSLSKSTAHEQCASRTSTSPPQKNLVLLHFLDLLHVEQHKSGRCPASGEALAAARRAQSWRPAAVTMAKVKTSPRWRRRRGRHFEAQDTLNPSYLKKEAWWEV